MPRKRVNGNIIGAMWQDIRLRGEIIAVNRRIGGLEIRMVEAREKEHVNRRTGGLEIVLVHAGSFHNVNRRIGGL